MKINSKKYLSIHQFSFSLHSSNNVNASIHNTEFRCTIKLFTIANSRSKVGKTVRKLKVDKQAIQYIHWGKLRGGTISLILYYISYYIVQLLLLRLFAPVFTCYTYIYTHDNEHVVIYKHGFLGLSFVKLYKTFCFGKMSLFLSTCRHTLSANGSLTISNIGTRDAGTYRCVGFAAESADLNQTYVSELLLACKYISDLYLRAKINKIYREAL